MAAQPSPGGGGAVIEKKGYSDVDLGTVTSEPQTDSNMGSTDISKRRNIGGGDFRVLLLDHESHTEQRVINAITTIIPNATSQHALNCYSTSKQLGQAIVTTALQEYAEFYVQELYKKGCRSTAEPDSTTL